MATVDPATFEQLVISHLSAAHRFAIRLTGTVDTAEDLVQDALARAARGWQTYRGEARFQTWLFQIIVYTFRDHIAHRRTSTEPLDENVPDGRSIDPAAAVTGSEMSERIAAMVSALPPRQREVLVLVVYQNMTCKEVADVLGLNDSNVRANLHYARHRLKEQLASYWPEHCHGR